MNKPNFEKPKKEAKKHKKESISLVNELKINKEEEKQDFLEEELEAKFWEDLYKEKLDEIKNNEDFKKAAIKELEDNIKLGKNDDKLNTIWALYTISSMKDLEVYKKEVEKKLNEIKKSEDFKKAAIKDLKDGIKSGKNGDGRDASWALFTISSIKNISELWQELADKKRANMARSKCQDKDIPKRPEIK